ncbi:BrnA antitoxin family protein [Patescibacteria group bacterium]|nr:BrnA antitoxin family protein [Patescibacteria group bacterium]
MKKTNLKPLPKFKSEDQERDFWAKADTSQYFDFSKVKKVAFPNLKPTRKPISLRLPNSLITQIKLIANKRDMPYQSLIKYYLSQAVDKDRPLFSHWKMRTERD